MIWLVLAALIIFALAILLPPLLRSSRTPGAETSDLDVYRDQLREIDSDLERGLISPAEADAARVEIKRRMLAVTKTTEAAAAMTPRAALAIALAVGFFQLLEVKSQLPGGLK